MRTFAHVRTPTRALAPVVNLTDFLFRHVIVHAAATWFVKPQTLAD